MHYKKLQFMSNAQYLCCYLSPVSCGVRQPLRAENDSDLLIKGFSALLKCAKSCLVWRRLYLI